MILDASHITFAYPETGPVLSGVDLRLEPGTVTGLFGPNGSGKSTLLQCLNDILRPESGQVTLDGRPLREFSPREVARCIAVVPQEARADLPLPVYEMVMLGRYPHTDLWGDETRKDRDAVTSSLAKAHAEHLAQRPFNHLSGGERQRVVIARALAQEAEVLLLDEPATHLDIAHQLDLYQMLRALACQGYAILLVSHDLLLAPLFLDRAVLLAGGVVVASGAPTEVLSAERMRAAFGVDLSVTWTDGQRMTAQLPGLFAESSRHGDALR
jgi:iron complex transport system ATP-binding protein